MRGGGGSSWCKFGPNSVTNKALLVALNYAARIKVGWFFRMLLSDEYFCCGILLFFITRHTPGNCVTAADKTIDHMNGKRIDFKNTHWKIVRLLHSIMWHICMDVGCNQKPATVATRSPAGNPCHFYATFSTFCAQLCTYIHLYICTFVVCLSTVIVYLFITRNNWISGQPAYPSSECPNERNKKTGRPMHSES